MKTSRFWGYFAKVGLGGGVAVALAGAPIVAHAEDNMPSGAIESGSQTTQNAATKAGSAADQAGSATSGAVDKAGNAASGAAQKAGDETSAAAQKASDETSAAAGKAQNAATGAPDKATGTTDDSSITDAVKGKLDKAGSDTSDIKVDTDNGVVTLSGTVHQESTRSNAVKMAKKSKGVKSVKDQIEVLPTK